MMNTLMPVEVPLDMITLRLEMAVPKTLLSWKSSVEATYRHHCNPPKTICGSGNGITQAKEGRHAEFEYLCYQIQIEWIWPWAWLQDNVQC